MSDKKGIAKHCEYLKSKIRKKQFQNDELRQRINKAIEYIKDKCNYAFTSSDLIVDTLNKEEITELLSILKGEDKE